jgi:hypothetical protein
MFLTKQHKYVVLAIIFSAVLMRLVPHIPNFAPLAAGAMFAAAFLPKKYIFIVPLAAAIISDYLLLYISPFGNPVFNFSQVQPLSALFNGTTAYVWGSFMICGALGLLLRKKQNPLRVGSVSVLSSIQFFLITNFGVWAAGAYSRGIAGIGESYIAGLPFLRWTLLGDLFYAACFFGIYALVTSHMRQRMQGQLQATTSS